MTNPISVPPVAIPSSNLLQSTISNTPKQPSPSTPPTAAKEISAPQNDTMQLSKNIGVVNPPSDMPKYSMHDSMTKREGEKKNYLNTLGATGLSGSEGGKKSNFFRNFLIVTGLAVSAFFITKKVKLSSIQPKEITAVDDLKKYTSELIKTAKEHVLKPYNLRNSKIRLIDSIPTDKKGVLISIMEAAREAKNIEGISPELTLYFKKNNLEAHKAIKTAISNDQIDNIPDEIINSLEYIKLKHLKNDKSGNDIVIETLTNRFETNRYKDAIAGSRIMQFFRQFIFE